MLLCRTVNTGFGLRFDRLLEEVPLDIFDAWREAYDAEPWGEERADFAAGTAIMHAYAAAGKEAKSPVDYMYFLRRVKKERRQSVEDMMQAWDAICDIRERAMKAGK